ncbi:N-acetylmuramoyl-L-alanine amidase family protein [Bacillus cereus group sp. MYBK34-1]|uniref:N-acetylmuramoyl-L-alanine amidase family protein n=1 Tax=Bacillus cereus group sp. MYBK34-1 TaxID=3450631 RepID=UPI003F797113
MKYKNRTHAKRKYKQALLATVATMSLGVSALGGTTSAFAAGEDNISVISSHTINNIGTQTSKEEKQKSFVKEFIINYDKKTGKKIVANSMSDILKAAKSAKGVDLNNFFRSMVMTSTDFMPYGMFVSPLIGLIWTENKEDELKTLKEELEKYVIDEIDNEQLNYLQGEFKSLNRDLTTLENAVNEKDSQHADNKTKNQLGSWAAGIEQAFGRILMHTSDAKHKVTNLPLYTKVAMAHITFLQSIQQNADKMNITKDSLRQLYTKEGLNTLINSYVEHISQTYDSAKDQYIEKINKVPSFNINLDNTKNQQTDLENRLDTANEKLNNREAVLRTNPYIIWEKDAEYQKYKTEKNQLNDAISAYKSLAKLYEGSIGDPTIQDWAKGRWVLQKSGKWHYVDKNDNFITGWVFYQGKKYYLAAGGDMVTGKIDIDGKTYFFKPDTGEMITGWAQDGDKYYYVSPVNGFKNWAGVVFNKGDLVTGWIQPPEGNTYYLSPADGSTNDDGVVFNKGERMTGWVQVKSDGTMQKDYGAWYYLDNKEGNRNFKGITGRMLHDEKATVKNKDGTFKEHSFNQNGTLNW